MPGRLGEPHHQGDGDEHQQQGREQAAGASQPEAPEPDAVPALVLGQEQSGDEEAGEDVEHVDAEEAATQPSDAEVEAEHQQDGDRPESVQAEDPASPGGGGAVGRTCVGVGASRCWGAAGLGVVMACFLGRRPGGTLQRAPVWRHGIPPVTTDRRHPARRRLAVGHYIARMHAPRSRWTAHGLAAVLYLALALALWSGVWLHHPTSTSTCGCGDTSLLTWFMAWPAYALRHGDALFFSTRAMHPYGINLPANTSFLAISLPLDPGDVAVRPGRLAQCGRHPGAGGHRPVGTGAAAAVDDLAAGRLPGRPVLRLLPLRHREPHPPARRVRHPRRPAPPLLVPRRAAGAPARAGLGLGTRPRRAVHPAVLPQLGAPRRLRPGRA